ncbi:hypothetical protein, partial [Xanthomonas oryzae]|uniref:hypothetical protein n=1 Tax=Xanthomonas oryzae TaxID=347 RepID=UPI001C49FBCB
APPATKPPQRTGLYWRIEVWGGRPHTASGRGKMLPGGSKNRQNVEKTAPDSAFFQSLKCKKLEF